MMEHVIGFYQETGTHLSSISAGLQISLAQLVINGYKYESIKLVSIFLHWLPVIYSSWYKLLVYACKVLHETAPKYLEELVTFYHPTRSLRSDAEALLTVPHLCGVKYSKTILGKLQQPSEKNSSQHQEV